MTKFNKTLSFDGSRELESRRGSGATANGCGGGGAGEQPPTKRRASSTPKLERERQFSRVAGGEQPLDSRADGATSEFSPSFVGLAGVFIPIQNDFSVKSAASRQQDGDADDDDLQELPDLPQSAAARYRDAPHWPSQKRERVKRFRFVVCLLALFGLALALMSRLMLNVSIVEMVRKPSAVLVVPAADELTEAPLADSEPPTPEDLSALINDDPLIYAANYDDKPTAEPTTTTASGGETTLDANRASHLNGSQQAAADTDDDDDDGLHFDWSKQEVNLILGAFYLGYMPGILLSSDLAQRYGAKYPLLACILGTALINVATPTIARLSLNLLISSRILLGLIQGSLIPALYELFNRWLTQTESSIFAPMIKVSMPLGSIIGTILPGLLARYQLAWPNLFYIGGLMCALWSLVWLFVATSRPQLNRFVEQEELNRIMRKKSAAFKMVEMPDMANPASGGGGGGGIKRRSSATGAQPQDAQAAAGKSRAVAIKPRATPWRRIATNPSVLALTLVKFTYNIGMDFIFLQLAVYLREAHNAPIETISAIASGSYCMQMVLISFVGWLAKALVLKRALGLSVTKWRKLFQGGSNLLMALSYVVLAYLEPGLELATALILSVAFFWMLGAGGESMVPYDLSGKFPASIMGFAHSVSICSGIALTAIFGLVLGEHTSDPSRWSCLFLILAGLLASGGLVFVCVLKAKPFLPGEKQPKAAAEAGARAAAAKEREANSSQRPTAPPAHGHKNHKTEDFR